MHSFCRASIVIAWLLFALGQALALNGSTITTANLPRIEAVCQFAQANSFPYVRFNIGMAEATKGSVLDTYAQIRTGELAAQYGRQLIISGTTQATNSKYWRNQSGQDDAELWNKWKSDESLGLYQDCHNPSGLYPFVETTSVSTLVSLRAAVESGFGRQVIWQCENEPGNVLDSRLDSTKPYGYVPAWFKEHLRSEVQLLGTNLAAPAWETQTAEGLMNQIDAEDHRWWGRFSYQSINWYKTPWLAGDTPSKWARRAVAELKAFIKDVWWPGRTVLISELGAPGCPKELRLACYKSFLSNKVGSWIACWWDFDSESWGVA